MCFGSHKTIPIAPKKQTRADRRLFVSKQKYVRYEE